MSDPAEKPRLYRLPEGAIPPEELEAMGKLLPPEATEAYLRWLESGCEGPDPCAEFCD